MSNRHSDSRDVLQRFRLDGRVALVTGAAGHLGRYFAYALASAGAHVILNGRHQPTLDELAAEIAGLGQRASVACFDITKQDLISTHVAKIDATFKRLDILVNNA